MNRTIKFRGKTVNNGEWVEGNLLSINNHYEIGWQESSTYEAEGGWEQYEVQSNTVGQFTGLHDKNGKEIYEGDIVKFTKLDGKLVTGFVKWDDCNPCMCIEFKTEYKQTDWEYDFIKCGTMIIEVIGNIHDNPELMEGGEK